jgi:hypothetical protein
VNPNGIPSPRYVPGTWVTVSPGHIGDRVADALEPD